MTVDKITMKILHKLIFTLNPETTCCNASKAMSINKIVNMCFIFIINTLKVNTKILTMSVKREKFVKSSFHVLKHRKYIAFFL